MLKKINKIFTIIFTSLFFFACSNLSNEVAGQANETGTVLKIAIEESSMRTIYPNIDMALDDFEMITLESSIDSVKTTLATWSTTSEKSAYAQMSEAKIPVSKGSFVFILTAKKGDKIMRGETSLTIDKLENTISFTLMPYSASENSGNIDVKMSYTNTGVKCVKAGLFNKDDINTSVTGYEAESLIVKKESGTYTVEYKKENVGGGSYMLTFFFYADEDGTVLLNTYNETVVVAGGFTSEKTHDFGDMNTTYTIAYNLDGGSKNPNPETYTIYSLPIILKSPKKEGYVLEGWYENEGFSGDAIRQINLENIGNKTLYAKWTNGIEVTVSNIDSIKVNSNTFIKVTGPITSDTIITFKEKIKSIEGITLDLSETTGLTSIEDEMFSECCFTSVIIPYSVTSIGKNAFKECFDLTSITIPNSVTSIGDEAFRGCSKLTSITIPNSITSIGDGAFFYCIKLTSITIPDSVTSIGENAFMDCGLTNVEIPSSVTSIGMCAFAHCMALTSVKLPDNATSIAPCMFQHCEALTNVEIPSSVTSIRDAAFENCKALTSIKIPNNVTSIGYRAFADCTGLTSVTIPNSVTSIGDGAFNGCTALTSVTIGNSVTSIGYDAFSSCTGLTSVTIGNSVTSINSNAFSSCTRLTSVTIQAENPPSLGGSAFYNNASGRKIYVPEGSVDAYKKAVIWRDYKNDILKIGE